MKTKNLEEMGLTPMATSEMREVDGGILLGLGNTALKIGEFIVGEVIDFGQGVYDGLSSWFK